jgi:cytochrome c1
MQPFGFSFAGVFAVLLALPGASLAEEATGTQANGNHAPEIARQSWSFTPPFGTFDNPQLQRGFQVYKEVCASCHSMRLLSYRNLGEPGGPQFSPKHVEILASQVQVTDGPNDKGETFQRPARPSDRLRSPLANDHAARAANNGALPPDLSVIAMARPGPDYIYALLTGYHPAPQGFKLAACTTTRRSPGTRSP